MICVSYTRYATPESGKPSIAEQSRAIADYARRNGLTITEKYSDSEHDENTEKAFLSLKEDGIGRKYECAVFASVDCFGKSFLVAEDLLLRVFVPAGISFVSVEDDFCSFEHSRDETLAFLRAKRRNYFAMKSPLKDKYYAGVKRSQQTKYGYKRVKGDIDRLEIDPVAEPVVREIFKMASEGISYSRISSILNSRGVMSNRARLNQLYGKEDETDGQWRNSSIFKILNDPVYHGEWKCFQDGKETIRLCPAYISREEQDVIILANKRKQHGPKLEDIFKHFVFDEETGTELVTCYSKKEGTSTYRFFDKNKKTIKNKTVVVTCSELNQIVVDRILEEKREAEEAADFLDSEAGTICVRNQLLQCKSEASIAFKELASVVNRITVSEDEPSEEDLMLSAKADKIEAELELLSDWFDQKKETLSVNNPWIRRYMTFDKRELVTKQETSEYVDRIVFDRYGNCRIELLFQDEKKALKNLMRERG